MLPAQADIASRYSSHGPAAPSTRNTLSAVAVTVETSPSMTLTAWMGHGPASRAHDSGSSSTRSFRVTSNGIADMGSSRRHFTAAECLQALDGRNRQVAVAVSTPQPVSLKPPPGRPGEPVEQPPPPRPLQALAQRDAAAVAALE